MSDKRQGTQERTAIHKLAERSAIAKIHFASRLLGKLTPEQIATLSEKGSEAKFDAMAEACLQINAGQTLVIKSASQPAISIPPRLKALEGTTIVPAFEKFVAKDNFKEDTSNKAIVKIYDLGPNFKGNFLKKTETDVNKSELQGYVLQRDSYDAEIMTELGEERRIVSLSHVWAMLERQPNGEKGVLLTNGWANIFYVEACDGVVWAVHAFWVSGDGWHVEAVSVDDPYGWDADRQVFSR